MDRTSKLGGDIVASTALARFTRARPDTDRRKPDPATEVLALDLLESARTYVRSMVRLPADAGVYFTGELEQRFNALIQRIQPEPEQNLIAYADTQLQQLAQEVERLLMIARAEASRSTPAAIRLAARARTKQARAEQACAQAGGDAGRQPASGERSSSRASTISASACRRRARRPASRRARR